MNLKELDPYAKAIMGAAVAAASAYAASTAAHHTLAQVVTETLAAFVVALAASWAVPGGVYLKELANGVVAGAAAFLASWGHVTNQQAIIATVVAFVVGTGLVSVATSVRKVVAR